jgi:pimeloyl-ACP methyl ester carboxylesterase
MASWTRWLRRIALGLTVLVVLLLGAGWAFEHVSESADGRLKPPGKLVEIGGRKMHLDCIGAGAPTVVLEPGAGEFALLVTPLQRRVALFTRVCSYDRAGYGWSDPAPAGRTIDARARDLERLLAAGGVRGPYVMVGASYGGFLVRSFARQQPGEVAGMVLVDAAEERVVFTHLPLFQKAVAAQRFAGLLSEFGLTRLAVTQVVKQAKAEGRIPADATPDEVEAAIGFTARPSALWTSTDEGAAYETTPLTERQPSGLGRLGDLPLIVIRHGKPFTGLNAALAELEPGWTAGQARLAGLSTDSRTIVATNNSHDITMENPGLVADAVRAIVEAVRTGRPLKPSS